MAEPIARTWLLCAPCIYLLFVYVPNVTCPPSLGRSSPSLHVRSHGGMWSALVQLACLAGLTPHYPSPLSDWHGSLMVSAACSAAAPLQQSITVLVRGVTDIHRAFPLQGHGAEFLLQPSAAVH